MASPAASIRKTNYSKTPVLSKGKVKGVPPLHQTLEEPIMFYTKQPVGEDSEFITYITDENVYTTCPRCGSEVPVNLADVLRDEDSDLYGTTVYCDKCAQAWLQEKLGGAK